MKKGFTLIELLVVISIISLGASIVFAATRTARDKAQDAKIKQILVQIRSQAGLLFSSSLGCYYNGTDSICPTSSSQAAVCYTSYQGSGNLFYTPFNNSNVFNLMSQAKDASGGGTVWSYCRHANYGKDWAAVVLRTDNKKAWCVDARGISKGVESNGGGVFNNSSGDVNFIGNEVSGGACGS